jgi:hypothetical protein
MVTAAIVLWNTAFLDRATQALREIGKSINDGLLQYQSPLGWEHINLISDYVWRQNRRGENGQFRPATQQRKTLTYDFPKFCGDPNLISGLTLLTPASLHGVLSRQGVFIDYPAGAKCSPHRRMHP